MITVKQSDKLLYETNKQIIHPNITYTLPKNESDVQYQDSNGIGQIKAENIPSIIITVKSKDDGHLLNTIANITSQK